MTHEAEIWYRNIDSGAILKLAQIFYQQDRLTEALALCLKAAKDPSTYEISHSETKCYRFFQHFLTYAPIALLKSLGEEQYGRVYRSIFEDGVTKENLKLETDLLQQIENFPQKWSAFVNFTESRQLARQNPTVVALWEKVKRYDDAMLMAAMFDRSVTIEPFDLWNEPAIAQLPDPDPEFKELSQKFLESVLQKLNSEALSVPPPSWVDDYYSNAFAHLNLPSEHSYSMPTPSKFLEIKQREDSETWEAIKGRNYYAFYRYLKTPGKHNSPIYTVVFNPNNKTVASGSSDGTIKLWNIKNKQELYTLTGHRDSVLSVAFSPDGQILASSSADATIKLWNGSSEQELQTLTGHGDSVFCIAFNSSGEVLASSSADNTVKLWDIKTGLLLHTLTGHTHSVFCTAFSPDGRILASGSADATIKLWDVQTGEELQTITEIANCVYSLCFHPKERMLVSSHRGETVKIWNLNTYDIVRTIVTQSEVVSVAISPDGEAIAGGGGVVTSKAIWLWNFNQGTTITSFRTTFKSQKKPIYYHSDLVYAVSFSSDRSQLVSGSRDGTVKLWGIPKPIDFEQYEIE